eukprot:11117920-Alexandrium_andersonii.AAC.1
MSASLVGSEMCIRDRSSLPAEQAQQKLAVEAAEGVDSAAGIEMDDADIAGVADVGAPAGEEPGGPA